MVSVEQLGVSFNGNFLFQDVSFQIKPGDRVGLIGKNGAGKSTMLKLMTGNLSSDEGKISFPKGYTIGYLKQDLGEQGDGSVLEEAMSAFESTNEAQLQMDRITKELETRTDYESDSYAELIQKVSDLGEQLSMMDVDSQEGNAEKILLGLGFTREELGKPVRTFSGGWRMRVELAKILLQSPQLLLLDEPTNHLDIVSIGWLEKYLSNYSGIIVLISHDRDFLDNVTNRTIELVNKMAMDMPYNYSKYLDQKEERMALIRAAKENQDKKIEDMEKFIERFRSKATKARQVQSRVKLLEKIERIELDETTQATMKLRFPEPPRIGKQVVTLDHISKSFGDKDVLKNISFIIGRDEKVAFLGKNGEGKSTLLKLIIGEHDVTGGSIELGHNVKMGYYAQNQAEELDLNKTVFETIDDVAKGDIRKKVRDLLGSFLFQGEDVDKQVKVLSGGEKARLALCKLLLEPYNFLVLDEPTNHLDIQSKEILKDALSNYQGTMVLVSHDRSFLRGLCNKIYQVKNRKVKEFVGGMDFYLAQAEEEIGMQTSTTKSAQKKDKTKSAEERKETEAEIKKLKNQVSKFEKEISDLEAEIAQLELKIAQPETGVDQEVFVEHQAKQKALEITMENWEQASEDLEALMEQR
jgi:ATP-binding cassette subfamily F protein 3